MSWRSLWARTLLLAAGALAVVYIAILVIDPYDTVAFAPGLDRQPIARDQRFSAPALARKQRFDSAVIGTSTTRLIEPARIDPMLGAAFVNLSIDNALPEEQDRVLQVFLRAHAAPRFVMLGVDHTMWCRETDARLAPPQRKLPDVLYDESRWNDLPYLLSRRVLMHAHEGFIYLAGLGPQKWGKDGYTAWLPQDRYDPARVQVFLHGPPNSPNLELLRPADDLPADRTSWPFAHPDWLARMLQRVPGETVKIVVLMPTHRVAQGIPGGRVALRLQECKRRLFAGAARFANTHVLDFAFDSDITRHDRNYWDQVHTTAEVSIRLQALIGQALRTRESAPDLYAYVGLEKRAGN